MNMRAILCLAVFLVALLREGCSFNVEAQVTRGRSFVISQGPNVAAVAGALTSILHSTPAFAEDIEYAELPPPYIPVIFGIGLLVVSGVIVTSCQICSRLCSFRGSVC